MKREALAEAPKALTNPPSLKMRLMAEAMIEAGEKNNEPSMVKAGKKILGLSTPKPASDVDGIVD